MITLTSNHSTVRVDPERGGSIVHFGVDTAAESNVFAEYGWLTPQPARDGTGYGDGAMDWLSEYRGGWQLLTPNGGAASTVDGIAHPFHGEVSRSSWTVDEKSDDSVTLRVGTHGPLTVRRTIALDAHTARVTATTELSNDTTVAAHAIVVEHIAFAGGDDRRVGAPGSSRWRHDPASPEYAGAPSELDWAEAGLDVPTSPGSYRLASLVGGSEGWIELERVAGRRVRVEWDPERLPYLWHWQERGQQSFPWFGRADISGLEPSSASMSDGLAAAVERGEAWTIEPGARVSCAVSVSILNADR
ncbi:hypothetical protein BH10ACT7_BH10ACT7_09590 [soil metagenome]